MVSVGFPLAGLLASSGNFTSGMIFATAGFVMIIDCHSF